MSTAVEVCSDTSNLNEKCKSRKANKYLSIKIKVIPDFSIVADAITEDDLLKIVQSFYSTSLE